MKTKVEIKNKEKVEGRNDYVLAIIFVVFSIGLEIINFVTLKLGVLPTSFGLELAVILSIAGVILMIPTKTLKIIATTVCLVVQGVLNIINATVFKNLFNITTIDMIFARGGETGEAFELSMINWGALTVSLILLAVYIATVVYTTKYAPRIKKVWKFSSVSIMLAIAIVIESTGLVTYKLLDKKFDTDYSAEYIFENDSYLYGAVDLKFANMQRYGFYAYYLQSLVDYFGYNSELEDQQYKELEKFVEEGSGFKYTDSELNGMNVSGSLAGDNLLVVMMESEEWFAIDPYNTPTLYNLIENKSLAYKNYYSRNSTNYSEAISILGNISNNYSLTKIMKEVGIDNTYSLPTLFKNEGYESVRYFHDYYGAFYSRYELNTQLGFDSVYALEDSTIEDKSDSFGDFVDDGEFVRLAVEEMMPSDKSFFSFYTTVSTHGPYTKTNDRFEEYYQRFEDNYENFCQYNIDNNLGYVLPEVDSEDYVLLKEYKSKAMALDNAFAQILNYLQNTTGKNGNALIEDTTIVFFADHNAYYSNLSCKIKGVEPYANEKTAYNVPMAIFSKKLGSGTQTQFCNTYDLLPTICDLFGLEFNNNLAQGYSVFSEEIKNSVFLSSMAGVYDENFYSLNMSEYYPEDENMENYDQKLEDFKQKVNKFLTKQAMIELYYKSNFSSVVSK